MIMLVVIVLFYLSLVGGLWIVLRVILMVGIKNLLLICGKVLFGIFLER